ncbi:putative zinc mynd-type domain containing protein [Erysiphe neolycopersici]|uniref:Putative zinc mynd-type domain containing protein n=1 Tax=Erysiphe neolycopersici TaxID=212602 RepID=A0A420HZP2_9PEZI|nr:putative zinc mynd-type domain containing protein [Erysiphe neolycopersici]
MQTVNPDFEPSLFFQSFEDCPLIDEKIAQGSISQSLPSTKYLLGTIQLEATLSTSPTYICKDIKRNLFAITVKLPANEVKNNIRGGGFDVTAWRRGWCLAILGAKKSGVENGKQGFIHVNKADVMVFPFSLERLIQNSHTFSYKAVLYPDRRTCRACCSGESPDKLKACSGCGAAWYCQKECQLRGWTEKGHKIECKVFMALKRLTPSQYSVLL